MKRLVQSAALHYANMVQCSFLGLTLKAPFSGSSQRAFPFCWRRTWRAGAWTSAHLGDEAECPILSHVQPAVAQVPCIGVSTYSGTSWPSSAHLGDEAECPAAPAGARSTADAVHIIARQRGQFIIDDQVHRRDVQAPARHVCCQQDGNAP